MLAVIEKGAGFAKRLAAAQKQLLTEGIKFELLTRDTYDAADEPYSSPMLPTQCESPATDEDAIVDWIR